MIGRNLNVLYAKKEKIYLAQIVKKSYSFNNSKRRRMALLCSKKTISVIKRKT